MAVGGLLSAEKNAVATDNIFLAEHGKEQGVLFFVIKSADSFRYGGK